MNWPCFSAKWTKKTGQLNWPGFSGQLDQKPGPIESCWYAQPIGPLFRANWPGFKHPGPEQKCRATSKQCRATRKHCRVTGKHRRAISKHCRATSKQRRATSKHCRATSKQCRATSKHLRSQTELPANKFVVTNVRVTCLQMTRRKRTFENRMRDVAAEFFSSFCTAPFTRA